MYVVKVVVLVGGGVLPIMEAWLVVLEEGGEVSMMLEGAGLVVLEEAGLIVLEWVWLERVWLVVQWE